MHGHTIRGLRNGAASIRFSSLNVDEADGRVSGRIAYGD